jgi:hypothetical protein
MHNFFIILFNHVILQWKIPPFPLCLLLTLNLHANTYMPSSEIAEPSSTLLSACDINCSEQPNLAAKANNHPASLYPALWRYCSQVEEVLYDVTGARIYMWIITLSKKYDNITSIFKDLHWLPIHLRFHLKLSWSPIRSWMGQHLHIWMS